MIEDFERCYIAVQSRDPRFDGWFFTAVTSTGIYCRPSCPAKTPMRSNVRFYPSAAAAQRAGFRACKRCRPNATPGSPEWDTRADVVARAMRLIADGLVDREGVAALAARLGYSVRQLERLLSAEVGAGPIAIARAQRAQTARVLIETTPLSMADVAFAAGFSSVRQFNDTIRTVFASSPTDLRSRVGEAARSTGDGSAALDLRLPFRQPLCPDNLMGHLAATAVAGVEEVRGLTYRRTLRLDHGPGIVELTPTPDHIQLPRHPVRHARPDNDHCPMPVAPRPRRGPGCRRRPPGRGPLPPPCDRQGSGPTGAAMRRRRGARHPGRPRPAGLDRSRPHAYPPDGRSVTASRWSIRRGGLTHLFPTPEALHDVDAALPESRRHTLSALIDVLRHGPSRPRTGL